MEIGYLWLALSLFLFLMTTGAALVLAAVAFPLVRQANEEHFADAFQLYRKRRRWGYGLLAVLSVGCLALLFFSPMYSLPDWTRDCMMIVVWLIVGIAIGSSVPSRSFKRNGYDAGLAKVYGLSQWLNSLAWFAGSCVLVYTLVVVVGLV